MSFTLQKARHSDVQFLNEMIPISVRALSEGFYTPAQIEGAIREVFGVDTQLVTDGRYITQVVWYNYSILYETMIQGNDV